MKNLLYEIFIQSEELKKNSKDSNIKYSTQSRLFLQMYQNIICRCVIFTTKLTVNILRTTLKTIVTNHDRLFFHYQEKIICDWKISL